MTRPLCVGVNVRFRVRMEDAGCVAIQNSLQTRWIRKTEYTPSNIYVRWHSKRDEWMTYEGSLLGAQTIAMLSGNITW